MSRSISPARIGCGRVPISTYPWGRYRAAFLAIRKFERPDFPDADRGDSLVGKVEEWALCARTCANKFSKGLYAIGIPQFGSASVPRAHLRSSSSRAFHARTKSSRRFCRAASLVVVDDLLATGRISFLAARIP